MNLNLFLISPYYLKSHNNVLGVKIFLLTDRKIIKVIDELKK